MAHNTAHNTAHDTAHNTAHNTAHAPDPEGGPARFVCSRCHTQGSIRLRGIPARSVGLLVILLPTAVMLTLQSADLGRAAVLLQPLWIAVLAIPVAWFLMPTTLRCAKCDSDEMIPTDSPRGKVLTGRH